MPPYELGYGYEPESDETIERILCRNVGRVVTIYTETIGEFTGLVAGVNGDTVRLITSIPSAPFERSTQ